MLVKDCTLIKPLICKKEASIIEVAKILRDNKQRRIIVIDEKKSPSGIISTTDINNRIVAENKDASNLKAKDIMTSPIYLTCDFEDNLNEVFNKMVSRESFFCPVVKDKKIHGILTYGELMAKAKEKLTNG